MNRRELIQLALVAFAGRKTALPAALVESVANDANWKPAFFNAQQLETVMAVTECIMPRTDTPGANDAKVYRYIDLLMEGGEEKDRSSFVNGLKALDEKARTEQKLDFAKCSAKQQVSILKELDKSGDAFFEQAKMFTIRIYCNTPEGFKELNRLGVPGGFACTA